MSRVILVVALLLNLQGCATFAKKPPTPADDITVAELLATPTPPNERYYILMFGSQSTPKVAKYTHSWATAVKVTDLGPGVAPAIDAQTISWMPATLDIHPTSRKVEPGVNLDMHTSITEMLKHDEKVVMWGPHEVWHGNYQRFMTQKQFIDSGAIGYQCVDSFGEAARTGHGCNCIHAITDMDPEFARQRYPLAFFGIGASRHAVRQYMSRGVVINPGQNNDWLIPALGLEKYPLERGEYRGPVKPFSYEAMAAKANK